MQYGFTLNSISFLDHLNYASPYLRATYTLGDAGDLEFAYTSGDARPDLADKGADADLQHELNTLGMFPRISLSGGRPKIQRGENFEVTYSRKVGSRTYQISAYRENISNAALSIVAPAGMYTSGDILPDLFTGTSTFNAGDFRTTGYTAAVPQTVGSTVPALLMYGSTGGITADTRELVSTSPDELRSMIRRRAPSRHRAHHRCLAVDGHASDCQLPGGQRSPLGLPGHSTARARCNPCPA